jgi:hypothetical protein
MMVYVVRLKRRAEHLLRLHRRTTHSPFLLLLQTLLVAKRFGGAAKPIDGLHSLLKPAQNSWKSSFGTNQLQTELR